MSDTRSNDELRQRLDVLIGDPNVSDGEGLSNGEWEEVADVAQLLGSRLADSEALVKDCRELIDRMAREVGTLIAERTSLESVLSQVRDLAEQWEADIEEYPRTLRGTAAAAAVLACKKELAALLPPPAEREKEAPKS